MSFFRSPIGEDIRDDVVKANIRLPKLKLKSWQTSLPPGVDWPVFHRELTDQFSSKNWADGPVSLRELTDLFSMESWQISFLQDKDFNIATYINGWMEYNASSHFNISLHYSLDNPSNHVKMSFIIYINMRNSLIIMSPLRTKRDIVLVWFFLLLPLLLLLLSEACPDHNFFVFPDRSIIFDTWVHNNKAVCRIP